MNRPISLNSNQSKKTLNSIVFNRIYTIASVLKNGIEKKVDLDALNTLASSTL